MYVPILQSKRGELEALRSVSAPEVRPLIDVVFAPGTAAEVERDPEKLEEQLSSKAKQIEQYWNRHCFVDTLEISPRAVTRKKKTAIEYLCTQLEESGTPFIPTVGPDREPSQIDAVRRLVLLYGCDVLLRVSYDDLLTGWSYVHAVRERVGAATTHLLLDFRSISESRTKFAAVVRRSRELTQFDSVFVAGSSMPKMFSDAMDADTIARFPRVEWDLWRSLQKEFPAIGYADYAVVHPDPLHINPAFLTHGGKIRYTVDSSTLVSRGHAFDKDNFPRERQYQALAARLVKCPEFPAGSCATVDRFILDVANGRDKSGSQTRWVEMSTRHHIEHVARQLRGFRLVPAAGRAS